VKGEYTTEPKDISTAQLWPLRLGDIVIHKKQKIKIKIKSMGDLNLRGGIITLSTVTNQDDKQYVVKNLEIVRDSVPGGLEKYYKVRGNLILQNAIAPVVQFLDGLLRAMHPKANCKFAQYLKTQPNCQIETTKTINSTSFTEITTKLEPLYSRFTNLENRQITTLLPELIDKNDYLKETWTTTQQGGESSSLLGYLNECHLTCDPSNPYWLLFLIRNYKFIKHQYTQQSKHRYKYRLYYGDVDWYAQGYARPIFRVNQATEEKPTKQHFHDYNGENGICSKDDGTWVANMQFYNKVKFDSSDRVSGWENSLKEAIHNEVDVSLPLYFDDKNLTNLSETMKVDSTWYFFQSKKDNKEIDKIGLEEYKKIVQNNGERTTWDAVKAWFKKS
jgi:hypothetical protein